MLGFIEPVYLIDKYNGFLPITAILLGLLHHPADLFDSAGYRRKINESRLGTARNNAGQGGFPNARRPPKHHRRNLITFNQAAKHLPLAQQMGLAGEFLQRLRAQSGR